jgi:hypothetical protein
MLSKIKAASEDFSKDPITFDWNTWEKDYEEEPKPAKEEDGLDDLELMLIGSGLIIVICILSAIVGYLICNTSKEIRKGEQFELKQMEEVTPTKP